MTLCIGSPEGLHMYNMKIRLGFKPNFEVKKFQHVFETEKSHFIKHDAADQNKLERDLDHPTSLFRIRAQRAPARRLCFTSGMACLRYR